MFIEIYFVLTWLSFCWVILNASKWITMNYSLFQNPNAQLRLEGQVLFNERMAQMSHNLQQQMQEQFQAFLVSFDIQFQQQASQWQQTMNVMQQHIMLKFQSYEESLQSSLEKQSLEVSKQLQSHRSHMENFAKTTKKLHVELEKQATSLQNLFQHQTVQMSANGLVKMNTEVPSQFLPGFGNVDGKFSPSQFIDYNGPFVPYYAPSSQSIHQAVNPNLPDNPQVGYATPSLNIEPNNSIESLVSSSQSILSTSVPVSNKGKAVSIVDPVTGQNVSIPKKSKKKVKKSPPTVDSNKSSAAQKPSQTKQASATKSASLPVSPNKSNTGTTVKPSQPKPAGVIKSASPTVNSNKSNIGQKPSQAKQASATKSMSLPVISPNKSNTGTAVKPSQPKPAGVIKSASPTVNSNKSNIAQKPSQAKQASASKSTPLSVNTNKGNTAIKPAQAKQAGVTKSGSPKKSNTAQKPSQAKQANKSAPSKEMKSSNSQPPATKKNNSGIPTIDNNTVIKSKVATSQPPKAVNITTPNLVTNVGDANKSKYAIFTSDVKSSKNDGDSVPIKPIQNSAAAPTETKSAKKKKKKKKAAQAQKLEFIMDGESTHLVQKDVVAKVLNGEKLHVNVLYLKVQLQKFLFLNLNDMLSFLEKESMFYVEDCWVECSPN